MKKRTVSKSCTAKIFLFFLCTTCSICAYCVFVLFVSLHSGTNLNNTGQLNVLILQKYSVFIVFLDQIVFSFYSNFDPKLYFCRMVVILPSDRLVILNLSVNFLQSLCCKIEHTYQDNCSKIRW